MKNRLTPTLLSVILLLFLVSCDKEETRLVDFLVEMATVTNTDSSVTIQLDNGNVLTPNNAHTIDMEVGSRVIVNYTPLDNGLIDINSIQQIYTDHIKTTGYPEKLTTSPIKIVSVWVSGNYLNISFQIDYHSKPHSTALYRDMHADRATLHFSYSREDDPAGAPTIRYLSFNLESLQKEDFTIFIHTHDGIRNFHFQMN